MGLIAKAVTRAVAADDDGWYWWAECDVISTIHRRQAWPQNWRDDAAMRSHTRYPVSRRDRNAMVLAEAQWTP